MFEILTYPFMVRALAASVLIGVTCSLVGVFVVLRSLSFIGAGIAHAAFAGVAFAFLVGISPMPAAIGAALIMVWLVGVVSSRSQLKLDASIGILFAVTMALAILFIGLMRQYNAELFGYLFGNILAVTPQDLWGIAIASVFILGALLAFFKEFQFMAFDVKMAEAAGLPTQVLSYLLLTVIALAIVISLKAVGELLVVALIIIPASTAYQLTHSLRWMMAIAVAVGAAASLAGLFISFYFDIPSGSSIVGFLAVGFAVATVLSPKRSCGRIRERLCQEEALEDGEKAGVPAYQNEGSGVQSNRAESSHS